MTLKMGITKTTIKPYREAKYAFERDYLIHLLQISGGNVTRAAKLAGRYREGFYDLMKKHDLEIKNFRKFGQGG